MAPSIYGPRAVPPVLGLVEGPFHIVDGRADVEKAAVDVLAARQRRVLGQPIQREVDLGRHAPELEAPDVLDQVVGQLARLDQFEEGAARVQGAHDHAGVKLGAVRKGHAGGSTVLRDDALDRRLQADLGAERLRRARQHLGELAVAALVEGPGAGLAVVLAKRVEEQHEAGPLRARPHLRPDDARAREVPLEQLRLEVVVQEVRGAAGEQADGVVQRALVQGSQAPPEAGERQQFLRVVAEEVGRGLVQQRLERPHDHAQVVAVLFVGVGVVGVVPAISRRLRSWSLVIHR